MATVAYARPTPPTAAWADFLPTPVFRSYWRFAAERHAAYLRRVKGEEGPWTTDPVISAHRFTNVYRACDRVSQYLINEVIYDGTPRDSLTTSFRVLLFKIFNRIDTWQLLERETGSIDLGTFDVQRFHQVLASTRAGGGRIYSAAYIMPPVASEEPRPKHLGHLELLRDVLEDGRLARLLETDSLEDLYRELLSWPSLGPFLAYQFAVDLNYTAALDHDMNRFVVAGPGARDGLSKCFGVSVRDASEVIMRVWRHQDEGFAGEDLAFPGLWGRRLEPIDVQNVFCEISKYARVAHPEVAGVAGRTRIKQRFAPAGPLPTPRFPPKWQLPVA